MSWALPRDIAFTFTHSRSPVYPPRYPPAAHTQQPIHLSRWHLTITTHRDHARHPRHPRVEPTQRSPQLHRLAADLGHHWRHQHPPLTSSPRHHFDPLFQLTRQSPVGTSTTTRHCYSRRPGAHLERDPACAPHIDVQSTTETEGSRQAIREVGSRSYSPA